MANLKESPSRTYVAMCNKMNFDGFYFRKFTMPEPEKMAEILAEHFGTTPEQINNANARLLVSTPAWYFLNILNHTACLEKIITFEDFSNVEDQEG